MPFNHSNKPQDDSPPMVINRTRPNRGLLTSGGDQTTVPQQGTVTAPTAGTNLAAGGGNTAVPPDSAQQQPLQQPPDQAQQPVAAQTGTPSADQIMGILQADPINGLSPSAKKAYQHLVLQAKQLLYQMNFQSTMQYLLTSHPQDLPKVMAMMVNAVLNKIEQVNGDQRDDILISLGQEVLHDLTGDLAQLGLNVDGEFIQKTLFFAIILWMQGHRQRLDPNLPQKAAQYLQSMAAARQQQQGGAQPPAGTQGPPNAPSAPVPAAPGGGATPMPMPPQAGLGGSQGAQMGQGVQNQEMGIGG